ncbi:unnamed protein product [Clavelina lepadiformis]|uniref:Tudor domain-containing protein n=1 Tax=Clavelina lepadiformis TaxID=159417 RepID=A0ABP0FK49_CLALP
MADGFNLKEGESYAVFLTDVNFSSEGQLVVWVQADESKRNDLDVLSVKLQTICPSLQPLESTEPGKFCTCRFSDDGQWYRARVESQLASGKWSVCFVDYGNFQALNESECHQMPAGLTELPVQAVGLVLSSAIQSKDFAGLWSPAVRRTLLNALLYTEVTVKVVQSCTSGLYVVDCPAIVQLLFDNGFAVKTKGSCYPYSKLKVNEKFKSYVAHVTEFAHLIVQEFESAKDLTNLMNDMAQYYSTPENRRNLQQKDFEVGQLVAAVYSADQGYYRARIKNIDGDSCTVYYIDYGDTEQQEVTSLYFLPKEFCQLEFQALQCQLYNVKINPKKATKMLSKRIGELLIDQLIDIEIVQHSFGSSVQLFIKGCIEEEDISLMLIAEGYGELQRCSSSKSVSFSQEKLRFSYPEVELGSEHKMTISFVKSDASFYVTSCQELVNLMKLMNNLATYCTDSNTAALNQVVLEQACCALYSEDGQWYRSKVVGKNGDEATVHHVDYGNSENCPLGSLKAIKEEFVELPCQAIPCHILKDLSKDERKLLEGLMEEEVDVKFLFKDEEKGSYATKLTHKGETLFFSANDSLSDCEEHMASDPKTLSTAAVPCSSFDDAAAQTAKTNAMKRSMSLETIHSSCTTFGTYIDVSICFIQDPECMWVQQTSNEMELYHLLTEMQSFYNNLPPDVMTFDKLNLNDFCCCKSSQTSYNWFRAQVIFCYADTVEVKSIDFGNEMKVKLDEIRVLAPQFFRIDAQALKCKLGNIKPASKHWTNGAVRELISLTKSAHVRGKFIERQGLSYIVDLIIEEPSGNKVNICEVLVERNHASWIETPQSKTTSDEQHTPVLVSDVHEKCAPTSTEKPVALPKPRPELFYQSAGMAMVGAEIEVSVCEGSSPDDFFLTINNSAHKQKYLSLFKRIDEEYNQNNNADKLQVSEGNLCVGLPCVVFYERSGHWCRGAVLNFKDLGNLDVCLVDYGRVVKAKLQNLRSISPKFVLQCSPAAMRCSLRGIVQPIEDSWSEQAINMFKGFLDANHCNLSCTVHGCAGDDLGTFFICSLRTPLVDFADLAIEAGFGRKPQIMGQLLPPFKLKSFLYTNLDVAKGKEDEFYITHIESPNLFYCQLKRKFKIMDEMMERLQCHCSENQNSPPTLKDLARECICFAKYDGDKWYRAHFISSMPNDHAHVLFVDYGNTAEVGLAEVQRFKDDEFFELPIQALPCSLTDVHKFVSDDGQTKILDIMKDLLLDKQFNGVVTSSQNGKIHLDLFSEEKRINDIIIEKLGLKSPTSFSLSDSDEMSPQKLNLTDPFFLQAGACEIVTISKFLDPRHFFVQFDRLKEQREHCNNTINGFYTAVRNADYAVQDLYSGDTVCSKQTSNEEWGRAMVLSVSESENEYVEVQYIDSGHVEKVKKTYYVKQLVADMDRWPKMAVPCSLAGIKPKTGPYWSDEAKALIQSMIIGSSSDLKARFYHKDKDTVSWWISLEIGKMDLATKMVQENLASFDRAECKIFNINFHSCNVAVINKPKLWKGEKEVIISHVESHDKVYLQKFKSLAKLHAMMDEINKTTNLDIITDVPDVGSFCLARYSEDGQFYRAQIADKITSDSEGHALLNVHFVDYGNMASISMGDVRKLDNRFAQLPAMSVCCKLPNIPESGAENTVQNLENLSISEVVVVLASLRFPDHHQSENIADLKIRRSNGETVRLLDFFSSTNTSLTTDHMPSNEGISTQTDYEALPKYKRLSDMVHKGSCKVYISHVENPGDVYCQLAELSNDLDTMMLSLESYYKEDHKHVDIASTLSLSVGSICVAQYCDDEWHRASVLDIIDDKKVKVQFVDYGTIEILSVDRIRNSEIRFCVLPLQAIHCHLAHVDFNPSTWTSKEIEDFDSRVANLELSASFSNYVEDEDTYEVKLRLPDGTLLNKEYMKTLDAQDDDGKTHPSKDNEPEPEDDKSSDTQEDDTDIPCMEITSQIQGISIEEGLTTEAYVSFAKNPNQFFLQLLEAQEKLDSLFDLIQNDLEADASCSQFEEELRNKDNFCVAKSPDDGEWYRGQIVESSTNAKIFFVDYGNACNVEWKDIRKISPQTAQIPMQAVLCSLSNVACLPEDSIEKAIDLFMTLAIDVPLQVEFLKADEIGKWKVLLKAGGVDISEKLSKCGEDKNNENPTTTLQGVEQQVCQKNEIQDTNLPPDDTDVSLPEVDKPAVNVEDESVSLATKKLPTADTEKSCDTNNFTEIKTPHSITNVLTTPSLPHIIVTSADLKVLDDKSCCMKNVTAPDPVKISVPSSFIDEMKEFCSEIKSSLVQGVSTEAVMEKVDAMILFLTNYQCHHNVYQFVSGAGDGQATSSFSFDQKRPGITTNVPVSPCKKPRLDKPFPMPHIPVNLHSHSLPKGKPNIKLEISCGCLIDLPRHFISPIFVHEVQVTCCISPSLFFVRPCFITDTVPSLAETSIMEPLDSTDNLTLCAFYSKPEQPNGEVTRGIVLSHNADVFIVMDIDSGLEYSLPLEKIFQLPEEMKSCPPRAIQCSLHGASPFDGEWSVKACAFFMEELKARDAEGSIRVEFKRPLSPEHLLCKWSAAVTTKSGSLSRLLMKRKFASGNIESSHLKPQSQNEAIYGVNSNENSQTVNRIPLIDIEKLASSQPLVSFLDPSPHVKSENPFQDSLSLHPKKLPDSISSVGSLMSDSVFASDDERNALVPTPDFLLLKDEECPQFIQEPPTGSSLGQKTWTIYCSTSDNPAEKLEDVTTAISCKTVKQTTSTAYNEERRSSLTCTEMPVEDAVTVNETTESISLFRPENHKIPPEESPNNIFDDDNKAQEEKDSGGLSDPLDDDNVLDQSESVAVAKKHDNVEDSEEREVEKSVKDDDVCEELEKTQDTVNRGHYVAVGPVYDDALNSDVIMSTNDVTCDNVNDDATHVSLDVCNDDADAATHSVNDDVTQEHVSCDIITHDVIAHNTDNSSSKIVCDDVLDHKVNTEVVADVQELAKTTETSQVCDTEKNLVAAELRNLQPFTDKYMDSQMAQAAKDPLRESFTEVSCGKTTSSSSMTEIARQLVDAVCQDAVNECLEDVVVLFAKEGKNDCRNVEELAMVQDDDEHHEEETAHVSQENGDSNDHDHSEKVLCEVSDISHDGDTDMFYDACTVKQQGKNDDDDTSQHLSHLICSCDDIFEQDDGIVTVCSSSPEAEVLPNEVPVKICGDNSSDPGEVAGSDDRKKDVDDVSEIVEAGGDVFTDGSAKEFSSTANQSFLDAHQSGSVFSTPTKDKMEVQVETTVISIPEDLDDVTDPKQNVTSHSEQSSIQGVTTPDLPVEDSNHNDSSVYSTPVRDVKSSEQAGLPECRAGESSEVRNTSSECNESLSTVDFQSAESLSP